MTGAKRWSLEVGERDYLDGIQSGLVVRRADGAPVAYAFEEAEARLIASAPDLLEAADPDTLDAIADEIQCFEHSARAASLRGIAKRQRAAIAKATGEAAS